MIFAEVYRGGEWLPLDREIELVIRSDRTILRTAWPFERPIPPPWRASVLNAEGQQLVATELRPPGTLNA